MLNGLRVSNFKAFGRSQRVPIRPITLLFGANSAGKSSVLHALALAHHAVETGELDIHRTRLGGDSIDLGGFGQYVHRRQRDREMALTFELDPSAFTGRLAQILGAARSTAVEVGVGMEDSESRGRGRVGVQRFSVAADGRELLSMSVRRGKGLRLDRADHAHPIFREVFRGILEFSTTAQDLQEEDLVTLAEVVDELVPQIAAWQSSGLFLRTVEQGETERNIRPISRGYRQEDLAQAARHLLPDVLRDLLGGLSEVLEGEIRRLLYLGPLRSYPPRHLVFSQHHDPNWMAGGGWAWDVVRRRSDIRDRVNRWLGDSRRLKTPYELRVRELLSAESLAGTLAPELEATLNDFASDLLGSLSRAEGESLLGLQASVTEAIHDQAEAIRNTVERALGGENPTFDEVAHFVSTLFDADMATDGSEELIGDLVKARGEVLQDLVLIDKRFGTSVTHRDVGIGVSQVLPVLVSAYASTGKLIAIEQPEIHLHPALQAELGDVFLESALGDAGNRFLIETHSEHLILRILRRIRETSDGELPEGATPVRHDQVAVLYVQPGHHGAEVLHLPITPDGDFERPWPDGFFAERARELF